MSNSLKLKSLIGFAVLATMLLAGVTLVATQAQAASCSAFPAGTLLKTGSRGPLVLCLQQMLNEKGTKVDGTGAGSAGKETTYFGPATKAAVVYFQKGNSLTPDGVAGKNTLAVLTGAANVGGGTLPAGCTSTTGYSSTTGTKCDSLVVNTTLPAGCTSTVGFSSLTGASCSGTTAPVAGTLQVTAAQTMPAPSNVPTGASNVRVGDFMFSAPSNTAVTLSTLTFKRLGVGTTAEISNAYIYDGANRLTSGRTFNSSTNEATFTINTTLAAGTSKVLSLLVSTTGSTAGTHKFSLTQVVATGGATVTGVPVTTNDMTISGVTAGTLSIQKNGSLTNPRVGDKAVAVSEFKLSASTEDAWVNRVTLTQGGSIANGSLTNFVLKQNGTTVATATTIETNSRLTLTFTTPFKIEKGNDRVFQLYADVAGRPADTISFYVDEAADTMATGGTYGYGMTPSINANFDASSDTGLTLTLQGGQFTVTFTGPSAKNIANTANDQALWEGTIYTANTVEVRHWRVRVQDTTATDPDLCDSSSSCMIQDIKIWNTDNNTVIAGPAELTAGANNQSQQLSFNDTYTLNAGTTTHIRITADVKNNPASSTMTLLATLGDGTNSFTQGDIKNVDSNTFLTQTTDVSPSGVVAGYTQTVSAAGLTLNTSSSPTDATIVKGVTDKAVTAFDFVVGSGDSVKINSLVVTAGMSGTNDNAYAASGGSDTSVTVSDLILVAKLWDGTQQIGQAKSFSSGTATFDNLNWLIPASTTKKLTVSISTNSAATIVSTTDFLRISIETSGVNAVDSQGNTVSGSTTLTANTAEGAGDVVVTISEGGTLTAAVASAPTNPAVGLMYSGALNRAFAGFKFTAQSDAFYVKKFVLLPYVGAANSAASNARISNLQVRYKNEAGTTVVQTVGLSGTSVNVDISASPMFVPANGDAYLEVLGDLSLFDILDGTEDMNITFAIDGADATNNQATGKGSNADVTSGIFATAGLDGSGNLVGNAQYVYRTNLSVAAGTASNNTSKTRSTNDKVSAYNFTSTGGGTSSYFRGSKKAPDSSATGWTATGGGTAATIATAGNYVSGSSAITTGVGTANTAGTLSYDFGASAGLENYNRISAWVKITGSASAGVVTFGYDDTAALASLQETFAVGTASTTATWYFVDGPMASVTSSTRYVGAKAAAAGGTDTVTMTIDDMRVYNDNMTVTVAGSLGAVATTKGLLFSLKDSGGTTKMYGGSLSTSTSASTVVLIPGDGADVSTVTNYSDVEIASSLGLDLWTNTSTLMATDTTANETLSISANTGTPSSAGAFRWYDNSDTAGSNNLAGITVILPVSTTIDFSNNY